MLDFHSSKGLILFEEFLDFLRHHGFDIGIDTHGRMYELLEKLDQKISPDELETLLAPLFTNNPREQQQFYELFEAFFRKYKHVSPPNRKDEPLYDAPQQEVVEQDPPKFLTRRAFYLSILGVLMLLLGYVGYSFKECYLDTKDIREAAKCLWQGQALIDDQVLMVEDSVFAKDTTILLTEEEENEVLVDSVSNSIKELVEKIPLSWGAPIEEDIQDLQATWFEKNGLLIKLLLIIGMTFALGFYELRRYFWRQSMKFKGRREIGPYNWEIQANKKKTTLYKTDDFYQATRRLREREESDIKLFDVDSSVRSTIESRGFPRFSYKPGTRPPEYLVLIEKQSSKDQLAMLFDQLSMDLQTQDLFVERYFFQETPLLNWRDRYQDNIHLDDLYRKYSDDRLVIFANADVFFDPVTDELASWASIMNKWEKIVIFTSKNPLDWSYREAELSRHFLLLPSTTEALTAMPELLNQSQFPPFEYWMERNNLPPVPELTGKSNHIIRELKRYFDTNYEGEFPIYRKGSGKKMFYWLCLCAIYAELNWDLLLILGQSFGERESKLLVSPPVIYKITLLPWFRTGKIPEEIRGKLIEQLPQKYERKGRELIIEMLKESMPPEGSFAAAKHQLNLRAQEAQLEPQTITANLRLMQEVQDYTINHELDDEGMKEYLTSIPNRLFRFKLPKGLNEILFREGVMAYGVRYGIRIAFALLIFASLIVTMEPSRLNRIQKFDTYTYFLNEETDWMRFETYRGNMFFPDTTKWPRAEAAYVESRKWSSEAGNWNYLKPDYNLSLLYLQQELDEEAKEELGALVEQVDELMNDEKLYSETDRFELLEMKSKAQYSLGVNSYRSYELDNAARHFEDALITSSYENVDANYGKAAVFLIKGIHNSPEGAKEVGQALIEIEKILEKDPDYFKEDREIVPFLDSVKADYKENASLLSRIRKVLKQIRGESPVTQTAAPPSEEAVLEPEEAFYNQRARVISNFQYGFVNPERKLVIDTMYSDAHRFSEGLAAVKLNGEWGYINVNGQNSIKHGYQNASNFNEGLASVQKGKKWGMIDKRGNVKIPFFYSDRIEFSEGLAAVQLENGAYGYIDKTNTRIIPAVYEVADHFKNGFARVRQNGRNLIINKKGECVKNCPKKQLYAEPIKTIRDHQNEVNFVSFSPDGLYMVTASSDNSAKIRDRDGKVMQVLKGHEGWVRQAYFSADGKMVVTASRDETVRIWNIKGKEIQKIDVSSDVWSVAFSPDGKQIATGSSDGQIRIYNIAGRLLKTLYGHGGVVYSVRYSKDGGTLLSASEDKTYRLWDVSSSNFQSFNGRAKLFSARFSPDESFIITAGDDNSARVWNRKGEIKRRFTGHNDDIVDAMFSPDGRFILTTSWDKTARVWNKGGRNLLVIRGHNSLVSSAAFSPDGKFVVTASRDNTVKLWKIEER